MPSTTARAAMAKTAEQGSLQPVVVPILCLAATAAPAAQLARCRCSADSPRPMSNYRAICRSPQAPLQVSSPRLLWSCRTRPSSWLASDPPFLGSTRHCVVSAVGPVETNPVQKPNAVPQDRLGFIQLVRMVDCAIPDACSESSPDWRSACPESVRFARSQYRTPQ